MKKYIAEAIGTYALTTIVALSLTATKAVIAVPLAAALTLMLFVYTIGSVSGAHINPAVTLGLMSIKKISVKEGLMYVVYQFIGAALALIIVTKIGHGSTGTRVVFNATTLCAEIVGAIFFTFGIASVVYGKISDAISGVVIGGSLLLGILFAVYMGSNGVLNPAVAFGISSFGWSYFLGPIIGSVIGFNVYKFLK